MAINEKQIEKMLQCTKRSKELIAKNLFNSTGTTITGIEEIVFKDET